MKGDFSKWDFDRKRNFNGVLHQQGRVLLDSDWNAQTRITNNWQDQAGSDIIGPSVAAIPADKPDGFKVKSAEIVHEDGEDKVRIVVNSGIAWADGLLVYLNEGIDVSRIATYLQPPIQDPPFDESTIDEGVRDAVILEVWREAINGFQIPGTLVEPALSGPDTTERVHTAMAFRLLRLEDEDNCSNIGAKLRDDFSGKGKLLVTLEPTGETDEECPVVEGGGYTGFEHNLYRIEIAQVDGTVPMFKWSQFNGGLVGRGIFHSDTEKVEITANMQAIVTSGLSEFYLEAIEEDEDLGHWKVTYGARVTLNSDNELDLPGTPMFGSIPASNECIFFRLWNGIDEIEHFLTSSEPEELRDGIYLEFDPPSGTNYVPGDYWTFPVRAGEIKNPEVLINRQPPEGVHYHRVPLAILNWLRGRVGSRVEDEQIHDCRRIFRPLTNQKACCSFIVGDGKSSFGDFNSVEEALRHLPDSGGEICLLPGLHETSAVIQGRRDIRIRGCGIETRVTPAGPDRTMPIFHIVDSESIALEGMNMTSLRGKAVVVEGTELGSLQRVDISNNWILAYENAIVVKRGIKVEIHHNNIRMLDGEGAGIAVYMLAEDSVIEHNNITVAPARSIELADIPGAERVPDPAGPCPDPEAAYSESLYFVEYTHRVWDASVDVPPSDPFEARGGIQIAGGCERVKVLDNRISGGSGNGITLGNSLDLTELLDVTGGAGSGAREDLIDHIDEDLVAEEREGVPDLEELLAFIYEVQIDRNDISNMGLSGIGRARVIRPDQIPSAAVGVTTPSWQYLVYRVLAQLGNPAIGLSIRRNHIFNCVQNAFDGETRIEARRVGLGGISLGMCEDLCIRENRIEDNGTNYIYPVCGIKITYGEYVDISENYIVDNGPLVANADADMEPGRRGGIVLLASSFSVLDRITRQGSLDLSGKPAARIHDNVVDQPAGQALMLAAFGPVSVLNNYFNTEFSGIGFLERLVGAVLILNIGGLYRANPPAIAGPSIAGYAAVDSNAAGGSDNATRPSDIMGRLSMEGFTRRPEVYRRLPNGNVLYNSNQIRVGPANTSFFSQLIYSADDVGFDGNQSDNLKTGTLISNTFLYGATTRASDNRFKEVTGQEDQVWMSLFSLTRLMNNTTANQGDHCIIVVNLDPRWPKFDAGNQVLRRFDEAGNDRCQSIAANLLRYVVGMARLSNF